MGAEGIGVEPDKMTAPEENFLRLVEGLEKRFGDEWDNLSSKLETKESYVHRKVHEVLKNFDKFKVLTDQGLAAFENKGNDEVKAIVKQIKTNLNNKASDPPPLLVKDFLQLNDEQMKTLCDCPDQARQEGNFDAALSMYAVLITLDPGNAKYFLGAAIVIAAKNPENPEEAKKYYEAALKLAPNEPVTHCHAAQFYFNIGEYETADKLIQKANKLFKNVNNPNFAAMKEAALKLQAQIQEMLG